MADKDFVTSQIKTDSHVQMAASTGASPLGSINRDFEERAAQERAQQMGMNYIDIEKIHINPDHLKMLDVAAARKGKVIPFFKVGKKIRLALVHPTSPETLEIIKKLKDEGYAINVNLASEIGLENALSAYENQQVLTPISTENIIEESAIESYQKEIENLTQLRDKIQSVTSEEALNLINVGALKTGASDIHYQPEEKRVVVRFRIDGVLQQVLELDMNTYGYLSNQLKYKSGMRLNVTNVPQDGRYFFKVNLRKIDVRVSSIPTEYGESFVCRLLDSAKKNLKFEDMGFEGRNLKILKDSLGIPNGMILVTGPTGSGKTTTLYSLLNEFNSPDNKIITLEDPIEYHLANITQSQINEKRGYTFGAGLRAILRQDPDIVMIGEIRDLETAETAAQASLTGHIMLSTLHTNSAIETIPRLLNIGLKPFMIAPALNTVVAQRLVRKVCSFCVEQKPVTEAERKILEAAIAEIQKIAPELKPVIPATLPHSPGCDKCSNTGFLGQISIAEMFINDDELKNMILADSPPDALFKYVRSKGMLTMSEDGILKVLHGVTTITEVERVTENRPEPDAVTSPSDSNSDKAA
ncbi:type II/IV secretion system protein [Candidatus Peregrinibacteria bacterium]|nr:type II/IV secretion system protein [Candidatus Peregrinibacteria bacterium]